MGTPPKSTVGAQTFTSEEVSMLCFYINSRNAKTGATVKEYANRVLQGQLTIEPQGKWEMLVRGKGPQQCPAPTLVSIAVIFVTKYGIGKAKIVEEWKPGKGTLFWIERIT